MYFIKVYEDEEFNLFIFRIFVLLNIILDPTKNTKNNKMTVYKYLVTNGSFITYCILNINNIQK